MGVKATRASLRFPRVEREIAKLTKRLGDLQSEAAACWHEMTGAERNAARRRSLEREGRLHPPLLGWSVTCRCGQAPSMLVLARHRNEARSIAARLCAVSPHLRGACGNYESTTAHRAPAYDKAPGESRLIANNGQIPEGMPPFYPKVEEAD